MSAADETPIGDVTAPDRNDTVPKRELVAVQGERTGRGEVVDGELLDDDAQTNLPEDQPVLSHGVCPLLGIPDDAINRSMVYESHVNEKGEEVSRTVHRMPEQVLVDPVKCGDCGMMVERHQLPLSVDGKRRCAIATQKALDGVDLSKWLGKPDGVAAAIGNDAAPIGTLPMPKRELSA